MQENSHTVSVISFFQPLNKECLNVGDKSQYVPRSAVKSYPFKQNGIQNVNLSDTFCLVAKTFKEG